MATVHPNNKKRLAIHGRYLNSGMGFHVYLLNLIEAIRYDNNLEITYIVDTQPKNFVTHDNEKVVVLKKFMPSFLWDQVNLALHLHRNKYDIILVPSNFGFPLLFSKKNIKCILILLDVIPIEMPSYIFKRSIYTIPFYIFTPISIFKSDMIITISKYSASSIKRIFHRVAEVSYPPLDYSAISTTIPETVIRNQFNITSKKYFIYTGGYDSRKNVIKIIKAFRFFAETHEGYSLVITGRAKRKVLKIINKMPKNKIINVGFVSEEEKESLIKHACALINASSMEGFGLPVVEAFRLGTPIITTTNSALGEIVNDAGIHIRSKGIKPILSAMNRFSELSTDEIHRQTALGYEQLENLSRTNPKSEIHKLISS